MDLIERQAAIDRILATGYADQIKDNLLLILRLLPPAQPEPCEDAVSRQWLLDEYDKRHKGVAGGARKMIEEAPSVTPISSENRVKLEQIECEDAVSRAEVLKIFDDCRNASFVWGVMKSRIEELPSVTPKYCPNCGSKKGDNHERSDS